MGIMATTGITCTEDAKEKYQAFKMAKENEKLKAITFRIENNEVVFVRTYTEDETDYEGFRKSLPPKECLWAVIKDNNKQYLIEWGPDNAPVKDKMQFCRNN